MEQEEQNKSPEPAQIQQADNTGLSVGLSVSVSVLVGRSVEQKGCGSEWKTVSGQKGVSSKPFLSSS